MKTRFIFAVALLCLAGGAQADTGRQVVINDGEYSKSGTDWVSGYAFSSGTITINGGKFTANATRWADGFYNYSDSIAIINGGEFCGKASDWGFGFHNLGTVTINGGTFIGTATNWGVGLTNDSNATAIITGGQFIGTSYFGSSGIENYGKIFIYGTFAQYGELSGYGGFIHGTLASGENIDIGYQNFGSICLMPVPEPSSILALLTGIAGLGGIALRRWK